MDSRRTSPIRLLLAGLAAVGLSLSAVPAAGHSAAFLPEPGLLKGMRLVASGPCAGAYQIAGTILCSHGADPVPEQIRQRGGPAPVSVTASAQAAGAITCDGDGESGKRVQALYVHVAGRPDRRSTFLASFRTWAANVDEMFRASAVTSGGQRRLRWVTTDECRVSVQSVALSPLAETSFATMISELTLLGYDRNDRKYLVWFDSDPRNSTMCGIGSIYVDDRAAGNLNDALTGYARADYACWNWSEGHELMHTLGGVQPTAPHATLGLHCTDEYDQMCYPDGISSVMTFVCPQAFDQRFDCGHDDYFSASPSPGNYLTTHWNTANSGWLISDPLDTTPPSAEPPQVSFVSGQRIGTNARLRVHWAAASDESGIAAYELQRKKGSGTWTGVPLGSATDTSVEVDLAVGATYTLRVRARDGAGNTGPWAATSPRILTLVQETGSAISYTSAFKRVALSGASGGYVRKTGAGGSVATFTFSGADVAFVSTLGANRGVASARLDGGAWQSLDLYDETTQTRRVAWSASTGTGSHTLEVRVSGEGNPSSTGTRVDVDAFLFWKPAN